MIERQFVAQRIKKQQIQEYMAKMLSRAGYSHTEIQRTPLGEKIVVYTTRPGLVVGKRGENIKKLTAYLKNKYKLENPQIEIGEIQNPLLDVQYVSDRIAYSLERFGTKRFKSIGYKALQDILDAGALGAEIVLSGKLPSARAKRWRFSAGYMKKSGYISQYLIKKSVSFVGLKPGTVGIKVSIMTPDIELPDRIFYKKDQTVPQQVIPLVDKTVQIEELSGDAPPAQEIQAAGLEAKTIEPAEKPKKEKKVKEKKPAVKTEKKPAAKKKVKEEPTQKEPVTNDGAHQKK